MDVYTLSKLSIKNMTPSSEIICTCFHIDIAKGFASKFSTPEDCMEWGKTTENGMTQSTVLGDRRGNKGFWFEIQKNVLIQ